MIGREVNKQKKNSRNISAIQSGDITALEHVE